jgi:Gpi18-like mannosyltransferase
MLVAYKIGIFYIIFQAFSIFPFDANSYFGNLHCPVSGAISLESAYKTWDAQSYLCVGTLGYANRFLTTIYPLFPFLIKVVSVVTGSAFVSGMVISNLASLVAVWFLYKLVVSRFGGHEVGIICVVLLLLFPTGFFLSLIYSDSLFLMLVLGCFYYLYQKKYLLASTFALVLPLLRPNGIFIVVPMILFFGLNKKSLYVFFPVAGLAAYFLVMFLATGDAFSGMKAQSMVVSHFSILNSFHPEIFLRQLFSTHLVLHGPVNSIIDRLFFGLFLAGLPLVYKKTDLPMFGLYCVVGMVPIFGSFMSYSRYLVTSFPLFIALARYFWEGKRVGRMLVYLGASATLFVIFLSMHALNYWVG